MVLRLDHAHLGNAIVIKILVMVDIQIVMNVAITLLVPNVLLLICCSKSFLY